MAIEPKIVFQGTQWRVVEAVVLGWGQEYTVEWNLAGQWFPGITFDNKDEAVNFARDRETA